MEARGRRPHLGEAAWCELLARFESADETVEAFCAREGVSKSTFNRWRSRGITVPAPTVAASTSASMTAPTNSGFVDLGGLRGPSSRSDGGRVELTLELGGGVTLHVVRG
jgi:putative transposase